MGITWPCAVLTLVFGSWLWYMLVSLPGWLIINLCFVLGLFLYHFSLQHIYTQQMKGIFRWSSRQLRIWNEVATIFLVAIVMLVSVKQNMSWAWGLLGLIAFVIALMSAIKVYRRLREKESKGRK
jgi:putative membrane protein